MQRKKPTITGSKTDQKSSQGSSFFKKRHAAGLYFNDGAVFNGYSPLPISGPAIGEVVFNTGMTGYVESLTDPSYAGQILVFTYPLIGNYGVQNIHSESNSIKVSGIVVSEAAEKFSHSAADSSLLHWLAAQKVPVLAGVDTRAVTKYLRSRGTMPGAISGKPLGRDKILFSFTPKPSNKQKIYNANFGKKIILVDCGAKNNILRSLLEMPIQVRLVPFDYDYTSDEYDAVVISNGPGDPADYQKTIEVAARSLSRGTPMFGICLGSQIMGLAAGGKTYKMAFGHRGHNQPCMHLKTRRCYITSQNHGYALDEKSLPDDWRVSFRNLNDGSVEGIEHKSMPFFSVQFHPEACPGPTDTQWLFERFYQSV